MAKTLAIKAHLKGKSLKEKQEKLNNFKKDINTIYKKTVSNWSETNDFIKNTLAT